MALLKLRDRYDWPIDGAVALSDAWVKRGLSAVYLPAGISHLMGGRPYQAVTVSRPGIATATDGGSGGVSNTANTFIAFTNLSAVTADAVAFGRLRYAGSSNYGSGLRFNASTFELDCGAGTGAWHYTVSSGAVLTGRHSYAGAIAAGTATSAGSLWRDGVALPVTSHSGTVAAIAAFDGAINVGAGNASGATAINGAIGGVIEFAAHFAGVVLTDDEVASIHADPLTLLDAAPRIWVPVSAAGIGTTLTPSPAAITLAGLAPTIGQPVSVVPGAAAITLAALAPTIGQPVALQPAQAAITLTGQAPTVGQPVTVQPDAAALVLTGLAPTIGQSTALQPSPAQIVVTGLAATIGQPVALQPAAAALTLTGLAPEVNQSTALQPAPAQIVVTGLTPSIGQPMTVQPGAAALTLAGLAPTISQPTALQPAPAQIVVTGLAPSIGQPVTVQPGAAALTLVGLAPTISQSTALQPAPAQIVVTGLAPSIGQPVTLQPGAAALTLAGLVPDVSQFDGPALVPGLRHLWAKAALRDLWARPERGNA